MKSESKLIESNLRLLNLAEHLENESKDCKLTGYNRYSFYKIKELYYTEGKSASSEVSRSKPNHKTEKMNSLNWLL